MEAVYRALVPRITDLATPPSPNGKDVLVPATRADWRTWLDAHPERSEGVWVVYRQGKSAVEGPGYMELVEESLCFGWIDSIEKRVDADRLIQWFSPRRPGAIWSALTKERIARLEHEGLMTDRGIAVIEAAKRDGSWAQYEPVEALIIPDDLAAALTSAGVASAFDGLSVSARKGHLWSVYSAKRPETRANRITTIVKGLK